MFETMVLACKDLDVQHLRIAHHKEGLLFQWSKQHHSSPQSGYAHERRLGEEEDEDVLTVNWSFLNEDNQQVKGDKQLVWWDFVQIFAQEWKRLQKEYQEIEPVPGSLLLSKSSSVTSTSTELV